MFQKGDRVRLSAKGRAAFSYRRTVMTGTVGGPCREPQLVSILLDGRVNRGSYHVDFWELDAPVIDAPDAPVRFSARREGLVPMKGK